MTNKTLSGLVCLLFGSERNLYMGKDVRKKLPLNGVKTKYKAIYHYREMGVITFELIGLNVNYSFTKHLSFSFFLTVKFP